MAIVLPPPVLPPSRVHVVHAAGRTDDDALAAGCDALEALGFAVARNPMLGHFDTEGAGPASRMRSQRSRSLDFLSGPDSLRARDLLHAITAPDVDAVIAARGGYGAMRLLDRLPREVLAERPKWIVGYSDITALHLWAYGQGVASIHGPMAAGLSKHEKDGSAHGLAAALAGHPASLPATALAWDGDLDGPLIGGNLSLLAALRPTRYWPDVTGAIVFIEEVGEPLYRIDRMLQTLKLAGGLHRAAGFAIGQLTGCGRGTDVDDDTGEARALELIVERLAVYRKPILAGLPVGHGAPNAAFIHGMPYRYEKGRFDQGGLVPNPAPTQSKAAPGRASGRPIPPPVVLTRAITAGVASGVQLHVSQGGEVAMDLAFGFTAWTDDAARAPVSTATRFDLASVTKAIATAVLAHAAIDDGLVGLDDRCPSAVSVATPTLRDLLRHTSGLPAYERVWQEVRDADAPRDAAEAAFTALRAGDPGVEAYSDVGYVALGRWLERLFDTPLTDLFDQRVASPLGIEDECGFGAGTHDLSAVAATEICPYRDATLQGVVHDENCQVLGGAAGHAGLFGTARAVGAIGRSLLGFGPQLLSEQGIARMWDVAERVGTYTLGWDTPSGPRSNAGSIMQRGATVGHLGFTGTSVWIDRARQVTVVLNTNRVHPTRDNAGIRWLRPAVHDAVMRHLGYSND